MVLAVVQEGSLAEIPEVELHHVVVDVEVDIGPHQPDNHAQDEGDGVFLQEGYVTSDLVHERLSNPMPVCVPPASLGDEP